MTETRIKISSVIDNQLPDFVREEFPLVSDFLSQYYISLENQGSTYDLIQNLDQYLKVDNLSNLTDSTVLTSDVSFFDNVINVQSTAGFPNSYGLLLIDSEIVTYTGKTSNSFTGCIRGFSGTTSLGNQDELVFSDSSVDQHTSSTTVKNLSILFLQEFFTKLKKQIAPGFEDRSFYENLNKSLFIKQSKDFYSSKGTDGSFEILFRSLYGTDVEVVKPQDFLIQPSDAQYRITKDLVVESIEGNILDLVNRTIYQDKNSFLNQARGTVTKVEKIDRDLREYYVISLDYGYQRDIDVDGSIFNEFSVHPKTKIITSIGNLSSSVLEFIPSSTSLDVDSTVGFPDSGNLLVKLSNGTTLSISYQSKTLTQFLDCTGITQQIESGTEIKSDVYAYAKTESETIKFYVTGVLSELNIGKGQHQNENYPIRIKTLGKQIDGIKYNNWFFNQAINYTVKSVERSDSSDGETYSLVFYDNHSFVIGDSLTIISSTGERKSANVVSYNNKKSVSVRGQGILDTNLSYKVEKVLSKVNSSNYPELSKYTSNVQNVYVDSDDSLYVAAPSLPTYLNQSLNVEDGSVRFTATGSGTQVQIGSHPFYTGDYVYFRSSDASVNAVLENGYYFIKKVNNTTIGLAKSRENLSTDNLISLNGFVLTGSIEFGNFVDESTLETKRVDSQRIIRKIQNPTNTKNANHTNPGNIGVLINGVEILNYKSKDSIFYGPIESISVLNAGTGYDVINPPVLQILDNVGSGCTSYCSVNGKLERIDVIDGGFDYIDDPTVNITGGSGQGAAAKVNLVSFDHFIDFNSENNSSVDTSSDTISFNEYHKFRDNEIVIYDPQGGTSVGGLSTNSEYYVSVQDGYTIKLHDKFNDSVLGINTISISSFGTGIHRFKSKNKKKKISSISVENTGIGYKNRKTSTNFVGINTASNTITIKNHGYRNAEILKYSYTETPISGLSTSSSYYVTVVDEDRFKLSSVGVGTETEDFYYKTKQYVNLNSTGTGLHIFNYQPITVTVTGNIGISTLSGQDFNAVVQPIFRGEIDSVFVENGGTSYGSEEILNYSKQPDFTLKSGSGAQLTPIIDNGKVVDVIVNSPGSGYNSPPNLTISGSGFGAQLTPVITDGVITSVKIVTSGFGYSEENTTIDVIAAGSSARLQANIKNWRVNIVERHIQSNKVTDDDGIPSIGPSKFGIQYTHAYAPRKLRSSVLGTRYKDGEIFYTPDLTILSGQEIESKSHSPIIGWAYDGNPIYGPYGYTTIFGGSIRSMVSGYSASVKPNRPRTDLYPVGFFIDDYEYLGSGDLDEHNGRFCVTPEYPNGVYAYFTTINNGPIESTGSFRNYKRPAFPYFVGNSFKSDAIEFNFSKNSNQNSINPNNTGWFRNISPYNLNKDNSGYEFITDPNKIRNQTSIIKSVSFGKLTSIGIETGGSNYRVGDIVNFVNPSLYSTPPKALVSFVEGKDIVSVSAATSSITDVEFYRISERNYVAISTSPHNFGNFDSVYISAIDEYVNSSKISVSPNQLSLTAGVGSAFYTGKVSYFKVSGNLSKNVIYENDLYQIGDEQVRVLNVDQNSSRIRVLREENGTTGIVTYSSGKVLTELPRKMSLSFKVNNNYDINLRNRQLYFDPTETLGIGTTSGVGINSTLNFSNPGVGLTQITIPTQSLYFPNHNLNTGDQLIYSSNGGSQISISTDGVTSFQLQDQSIIYAAKISDNLIGISTFRVGLSSIGNYVGLGTTSGLLYFTNVGSGNTHSFKTNYQNILNGEIWKNEVTVSTSSSHGLSLRDNIFLNVKSGISTNISIQYNDYNRRIIVDPVNFTSPDVDVAKNTIRISNHGYFNGQKIIHKSTSPSGGLVNEKIYYVVVLDTNTIKLSDKFYSVDTKDRQIVDITSASFGTILPINPPINVTRNNYVIFDVSDASLSFTNNSVLYSAFDLNFYIDPDYNTKFDFSQSDFFEVVKSGRIGIDTNATVSLRATDETPKELYYRLDPVNLSIIPKIKREVFVDNEFGAYGKISLVDSVYSGAHNVVGLSSNTFKFILDKNPESFYYDSNNASFNYYTDSKNAFGPIHRLKLTNKGNNLKTIPNISNIVTGIGTGAVLNPLSEDIGSIVNTEILDIGFDYPSDFTLRPTTKSVDVLRINPQSSFKSIGISSVGKGYSVPPNLVVIDGLTNQIISDVDLEYNLNQSYVNIIKNTKKINNVTPTILPINNVNGVGISSIRFDPISKDVIVTLGSSFSDIEDYPFEIGDKVLIENISVGIASTSKGYNSESYNYTLFEIVNLDANIGGVGGTVSYNISSYLSVGETPGVFDPINSSGRIIPQKHFPIFNTVLQKNEFYIGENVFSESNVIGEVIDWDPISEFLKVSSSEDYIVGDIITGESSTSTGTITSILQNSGSYQVSSSSVVKKGWEKETGFLDNQFQRIHDNDYYQYFSYSLRSKISFDTWENAVSNLNHTAGFKKFSDLIIESSPVQSGISTDQNLGDVTGIADLYRFVDLNCVNDFDLVGENNLNIDGRIKSNEINFESRILQDYIESIGNRVLLIDDISDQFNSNPRSTIYGIADIFNLDSRSSRYLLYVQDRRFTSQRQVSLVTLIQDGLNGYMNEYASIYTYNNLGSFDFRIFGTEGNILYYPQRYEFNDYDISAFSINIEDDITSIGSVDLGDTVFVGSSTTSISTGTSSAQTIVGIASTYRSSKILVQIGSTDSSYYETDELMILHNGSEIILSEYGQLTTSNLTSYSSSGLGTYHAYYSGSNVNVDLIPSDTTTVGYDVNCVRISIASSGAIGVGTEILDNSFINSNYVAISSSITPGITTIASFDSNYHGAYYMVSVEDTTNNEYQVSEVMVVSDGEPSILEFGIIQTNSSIGSIGATVTSFGYTDLTFTPNANIDVEVRVYQNSIGLVDESIVDNYIDLNNAHIQTGYGFYFGTQTDIKKEFNLTHKQKPIFERYFDGSSSDIIDINNNTIQISEHFFVTGEKVLYNHAGAATTQAVGIATTTISGIGSTDKLPGVLYIVKENDLLVKVAASASDALRTPPNVLELTHVGIGTSHRFVSTNQNARALIAIDNYIQSPIVSTSITTKTSKEVLITDDRLTFSGITSFFGGDLIKIDDEIMRIDSVGFGSTNVLLVRRSWAGTGLATHAINSLVTKIQGNYNIVDNTINFVEAPYGLRPIASITNPPDSRDFIGIQTHSTFSGRAFLKSGVSNSNSDTYSQNYIFDDISSGFTGTNSTFTLTSNGSNITGFSTSNAIILVNDIFQEPQRSGSLEIIGNYDLSENSGITSITFTGTASTIYNDINVSGLPRGGIIVSVGSSAGLGYQPLVSAGGTATVSIAGTISNISIGNSGSGYRSGIQTVNVGVATSTTGIPDITYVGTATIVDGHVTGVAITNPGTGYTTTNAPIVIFDSPLSYSNIPLIYSSSSSGLGTGAYVDVVVGQGSSVLTFEITNTGYNYGQGEILTVNIGGATGIPTDTSLPFQEFQITIDKTFSDKFVGWSIGDLQVIDHIDSLFDGERTTFPIAINGEQTTIRSKKGSNIEVKSSLLIFINDILQVPDVSYIFNGGSIITFKEAPKPGDTSKILFYRGNSDLDTQNVDILETVKEGDTLTINDNLLSLKENSRLVLDVVSTDLVETNVYSGPGITQNKTLRRPVIWCRQTEDKIINGQEVSKDRTSYEPLIQPTTNIIQSVSVASTQIFVESVKTFFDSADEYLQDGTTEIPQKKIIIVSQNELVSAAATAIVSTGGTISSISITSGGVGYTTNPTVIIESPVGLGTTQRASASSVISVGGTVSSISIVSAGTGYTTTNPPVVLIEPPNSNREVIDTLSYDGDFGIISGMSTTSVGVASTGIVFDLFIPQNSFLRDISINSVGIATTGVSGIQTGYYFVIFNSNVGYGLTSLDENGSIVSIGNSFIDNVYHVSAVSIGQTDVIGVGLTYVAKVTVSVSDYNGLSGFGYSSFYGEYSWGRIHELSRDNPKQFVSYNNGLTGVSTSPSIQRYNPLKYRNYVS